MSSSARNLFKILSSFLIQKNPHHEEVCVHEETTAGLWAPLPDSHVVLFLDFDGVCHRCKNETFERMPLLEKLLDNCPAMVIVISSSWRECANTSYLKSLFRVPYRDKIIGATGSVYLKHGQTGVRAAGLAPIFPYTFYHLTHYWFAAADIPVANDTPVHYADAIRCNVRRPPQGSLPLLTRRVSA